MQQPLDKIVTTMVNSEDCRQAMICSNILFGHTASVDALYRLSEEDLLSVCATVPKVHITSTALSAVDSIVSLVSVATENRIMPSKSEARRMIAACGIKVNKVLITGPYQKPDFTLLHNRYLLAQKGKKNYHLIVVQ